MVGGEERNWEGGPSICLTGSHSEMERRCTLILTMPFYFAVYLLTYFAILNLVYSDVRVECSGC